MWKHPADFAARICYGPVAVMAAAAVSAAGSIQQGNAQAKSLKSQAAADDYNATIDRQNEASTNSVGTQKELATRDNNAKRMGEARAAVGEANIGGPQGGTASGVLEEESVNNELSALGVRYQRDTQANAYEDEARQNNFQAGVARNSAKQARIGGYLGAVGKLIGGAYTASNMGTPAAGGASSTPALSPAQQYGPFDNSLPWRNTPYLQRGGAF